MAVLMPSYRGLQCKPEQHFSYFPVSVQHFGDLIKSINSASVYLGWGQDPASLMSSRRVKMAGVGVLI